MPRYLGIDYGHKRIGLAVADADGRFAVPLKQLDRRGSVAADAAQLHDILLDYDLDALVIGLPLNMDGTEGEQAKLTRGYGAALAAALNMPVEFWDERLSSAAADQLLDQREELTNKKRKARRDALAAQIMLQSYLDHRRNASDH